MDGKCCLSDLPRIVVHAGCHYRRNAAGRVVQIGKGVVSAENKLHPLIKVRDNHRRLHSGGEIVERMDRLGRNDRHVEPGDGERAAGLGDRHARRTVKARCLAGETQRTGGDGDFAGERLGSAAQNQHAIAGLDETDGADEIAVDLHRRAGGDLDRGSARVAEDPDAVRGRNPVLVDLQRRRVRDHDVGDFRRRGVARNRDGVHELQRIGVTESVPGLEIAGKAGDVAGNLVQERAGVSSLTEHRGHDDFAAPGHCRPQDALLARVVKHGGGDLDRGTFPKGVVACVGVIEICPVRDRTDNQFSAGADDEVAERQRIGLLLVGNGPDARWLDDDGRGRGRRVVRAARLRAAPMVATDEIDGVLSRDAGD